AVPGEQGGLEHFVDDHGADTPVGEDFQKEGMRNPAVDDVCLGDAPFDGVQACFHLGGHSRGELGEQGAQFVGGEAADEFGVGRVIGEQPLDVGEHDELSGVQGDGECGGGGVGVDVVDTAVVGPG